MLLPRLHTHELPWPHYWNLISLPCLLLHPKNTDYLTPSMHWTKIFVECYSLFSGFCKNMTALMISFLKIPLIFENTSIASNIRKHIFKCKSRLHFVLSILLHVNGQLFFFLFCSSDSIISTVLSPHWPASSSTCTHLLLNPLLAIAPLGEAGSLSPANASGLVPCVLICHVLLSPFVGRCHFFWALGPGPVNFAAHAHHRLPASSHDSARSYPSSWYRHLKLPNWMRWDIRPKFLMLNLSEEYESCVSHVSIS